MNQLYKKFCLEFPEIKLSLSTFKRRRPHHMVLSKNILRKVCLCRYHQNFALKLQAIKHFCHEIPASPSMFLESIHNMELLLHQLEILPNEIAFAQWQMSENIKYPGKKHTKLVNHQLSKNIFIERFAAEALQFQEHDRRVKHQFAQLKSLKENLKENHFILLMDFSENYTCNMANEIQSAYWSKDQVTIHPAVVY